MKGEPLEGSSSLGFFGSLGSRVSLLRPGPTISVTIAWLRQPSATNSAPSRYISFRRTLPALSMKLTPHKLMQNFGRGEVAPSSRQHCSKVATRGPEREPSTLRNSLPRLFSVVILSMLYRSRCYKVCTEDANYSLILFTIKLLLFKCIQDLA